MGTNATKTQANNHRPSFGQPTTARQIRACPDYQRLKRLIGPTQLQLEPDLDPMKYAEIVRGLQHFYGNHSLWDPKEDATLLRKHMVFTLCVPGGKADRAREAVDLLSAEGYLNDDKARSWDDQATEILRPRVRFHNQKAKRCNVCLVNFDFMRRHLPRVNGYMERRLWLEANMPGYGPKAATHFMRNSGLMHFGDGLPIIDVHIHKALEHYQFRHTDYEESCESFTRLAELVDVPVLTLDAVLWCAYAHNWKLDGADFDNFGDT